jgi:hypothetical protein
MRDAQGVKDTLEGVVLAMPTKLQISPRGETEVLWQLPNEPLISVQGKKSIVMSSIDGQDGTFKELYSVDDWRVVIQGICINDDSLSEEYPQEQLRKIKRIINVKSSLKVVNDMLTIFGINRLALVDYDFPSLPGVPSAQPYTLTFVSDNEFELELKNRGIQ